MTRYGKLYGIRWRHLSVVVAAEDARWAWREFRAWALELHGLEAPDGMTGFLRRAESVSDRPLLIAAPPVRMGREYDPENELAPSGFYANHPDSAAGYSPEDRDEFGRGLGEIEGV